MCNARLNLITEKHLHLEEVSNASNLLRSQEVARDNVERTDLESLDRAYVVALSKIDEENQTNLIKNVFKS